MSFSRPCNLLKTRPSILSHFTGSPLISVSIYMYLTWNSSKSCRNAGKHHFTTLSKVFHTNYAIHLPTMCLYAERKTWQGPGQPSLDDMALSRDLDYISIGASQPQQFCHPVGKKNPSDSTTSSITCTTQYFPNSDPWRSAALIHFKAG